MKIYLPAPNSKTLSYLFCVNQFKSIQFLLLLLLVSITLACDSSGGGQSPDPGQPGDSFKMSEPAAAAANNSYGQNIHPLANGNLVITAPKEDNGKGAVHLYNPITRTVIASMNGLITGDNLGSNGIIELPNGHFLIMSPFADVGANDVPGSIRMIDGTTGMQIGATIGGNSANENIGFKDDTDPIDKILILPSGNFALLSTKSDLAGVNDGSVALYDGNNATQLGSTITGGTAGAELGYKGMVDLGNGNFVVSTKRSGNNIAHSIKLINGSTANLISDLTTMSAYAIATPPVVAVGNGNFVVAQPYYSSGGVTNKGRVTLIDGSNGSDISFLDGTAINDFLGFVGVTRLTNNNYVISTNGYNSGRGATFLVDSSGNLLATISGDLVTDYFGVTPVAGQSNGNYMMVNPYHSTGGNSQNGSIFLVNGSGNEIGSRILGTSYNSFRYFEVVELPNGNIVVAFPQDDNLSIANAGSIRLIDGSDGSQISANYGDNVNDGDNLKIFALANNNYLIASYDDDVGGLNNAGSVMLMNGSTGALIASIEGNQGGDEIGFAISLLANNSFAIISPKDDSGSVVDAGSMRLMNGATGAQLSLFEGLVADDFLDATVMPANNDYYMLGMPKANTDGNTDSGLVLQNYYL